MAVTVTAHLAEDNNNNALLTEWIAIGITMAIFIILVAIVIVIVLTLYFRKASQKTEHDNSYSILHREATQQLQPQSLHPTNDLYDHIQLSPSTGQAEFISKTESDNTNSPSPHQGQHSIYYSVDTEQPKLATMQITDASSNSKEVPSHDEESISEQLTYAVVNKKRKQTKQKEPVHCPSEISVATNVSSTNLNTAKGNKSVHIRSVITIGGDIHSLEENVDNLKGAQPKESLQELYTAVRKKTKDSTAQNEEEQPPIPPHEQLYTAVNKKTQHTIANDEVESPPIPPHTVEELYTAVMKKPKARETDDEVEAPPIPPHTVEELYTAVQKNKK